MGRRREPEVDRGIYLEVTREETDERRDREIGDAQGVSARLPLTMVMYFLCYIDRINVSFAALTMNKDIGLTAAAYGFSSTAFYVGYVLFEVP